MDKELQEVIDNISKDLEEGGKLTEFKGLKEKELNGYHFTFGMAIRNNLKLWAKEEKTDLVKYFNSKGIEHPDDMSGIIMTSMHRHVNGKDIELDTQIKKYIEYWKNLKDNGEIDISKL